VPAATTPAAPAPVVQEVPKPYVPTASCPLPAEHDLAQPTAGDRPAHAASDTSCDEAEDEGRLNQAQSLFEKALDAKKYDEALACGQVVSRLSPDDAQGPLDRALALDSLGQPTAAHQAYERAVALAPDDPAVLEATSSFLIRSGDDDALETSVIYTRRGRDASSSAPQQAKLAALESRALNELGRSDEALRAAESSLALDSDMDDAAVERAVALFELLRFKEAGRTLNELHGRVQQNARVDFYLGLFDERDGHPSEADALFGAAAHLDPDTYPAPMSVTPREFQTVVDEEVKKLTPELRKDLSSTRFSWEDIPTTADLEAGDPVLSPEIVGVYRPGPDGAPDSILLYRKNLLRVAHTQDELHSEVRDTLLHELGHLHGENDEELRDRGL
jgi:tetratricopeptide (TPR) repeat protein